MERTIWEPLQRFESRDYLVKYYKQKHGRDLSAKRSQEIGASFTQGREYFSSAIAASNLVKPLLLYYGATSLSRGLILLQNSRLKEESLPNGHGLETVDWRGTLSSGIESTLDLKVRSCKGIFSTFVTSIGNQQSISWHWGKLVGNFKGNSSRFFRNDFGKVKFLTDKSTMTLDDLLSREIALSSEYSILGDITPGVMEGGNKDRGLVVATDNSIQIHFEKFKGIDLDAAIKSYSFPETAKIKESQHPKFKHAPHVKTVCVEIPASGKDREKLAPMFFDQEGSGTLIRPFPNGDNLVDIHRIYISSYIIGMLCRYFPSHWTSILNSQKGDLARSVIISSIYHMETTFPKLIRDYSD